MKLLIAVVSGLLVATTAGAAALPGFRAEVVGSITPFATSLVVDSAGTIYYTVASGTILRYENGQSTPISRVTTEGIGNSGLLGMALMDDSTAVIHYTRPNQTYDVLSRIDLRTGEETLIHEFACDIDIPERGSSTEHHGGNPIVASDGSIFVGIGDYGGGLVAALEKWNGGKIFRIFPDGLVLQFARGLRNPFDLVWDEKKQQVIVADNGPVGGDELHLITEGANCGWPWTYGSEPKIDGLAVPDYVFPNTVAPTGNLILNGAAPFLRSGYLLGAFVTKAIYYFPDLDAKPIPDPVALIERETSFIIDVAQSSSGDIYFTTGTAIYRLVPPERGDCNGDGKVDGADIDALKRELADGDPHRTVDAQTGAFAGSWGCDANEDSLITSADLLELPRLLTGRRRAIRTAR